MTLNISTELIQVNNAAGQLKFSSDNKLIYQRYSQTGTINVTGIGVNIPFTALKDNEFLVLTIKINSSTGSAVAGLIGKEVSANGSTPIDYYARTINGLTAIDSEVFGVEVIRDYLAFSTLRYNYLGIMSPGTTTTNLTYKARVLSYL